MLPTSTKRVETENLLTVKEAAAFLSLKPRTIYAMVAERRIPYRKAGRLLRFERAELLEWSKEQAATDAADGGLRVVNW
ncbi:MAG TPA: helix-turn-helix domain-containing protein [Pyrinomonadaceae bacterium]|jgi:excisionase family DNA binding protein|nr:helix-turn-helix domain-containing protein [Pyrinomonadaceae bacterium]